MTTQAQLTLLSGVAYDGREITSPRLRALLALLAGDIRVGVSNSRLMNGLWPDEQPENPAKAVQILVSRARSQLGTDLITTTPTGYRLNLDEGQVDAAAVVRHAASSAQYARADNHAAALAEADTGLALWGSEPVDDGEVPSDPLAELRIERIATYRSLQRSRALALARLGRYSEALDPLAELFLARPRDEELLLELLRSEAATAGPAAALTRYETYRSDLRDELGADPGASLQALYQDLLRDTAPTVRRGVTYEPNPLLGRDDAIADVEALLHSSRVTSIIGPGGLGKTRLAQAVLQNSEQRLGFFVPLAGVTDDEDVVAEVASGVGAGEGPRVASGVHGHDLVSSIVSTIGPAPALVVLDNCEQVIDGVAELVQSLVSMTESIHVLTTSRALLGLSSEAVYQLPELTLETMVELFTQRARAARPDIELPQDVVTEICQHLDGLPLAVELAAARVRVMSVTEIARRLEDRFSLLRGGPRDTPERHRTLQAVVEWSWNLLDPSGQHAMRTLSVFPSGFTAAAARHVLGGDVLDVLEQLVEQSLLTVADSPIGSRFRMLETVREFSSGERTAAALDDTAIEGLLSWARDLALTHYEGPFGPDPYPAVDVIRAEQDNLGFALRQAIARNDNPTVACVAAVLGLLWMIDTNFPRMSVIAEETSWPLSHYRPEPEYVEITRTALVLSAMYTFVIEGPRAVRPLAALRRLPPPSPKTFAGAASILFDAGADTAALLELGDSDEPAVAAAANAIASYIWEEAGDTDRAVAVALRSVKDAAAMNSPTLVGLMHSRVGELYFQLERPDGARRHFMDGLPVTERLGSRANAVGLRAWIVLANLQLGNIGEAERWMAAVESQMAEKFGTLGYDLGPRAELDLARGEIEGGLAAWREIVALLRSAAYVEAIGVLTEMDPWTVEARVTAIVAHAHHGRLDLVTDMMPELEDRLGTLLESPLVNPPPYVMELQLIGSMLLALGLADLDQAQDDAAVRAAVRMIALAERHGYIRNFQPTMESARIRQHAIDADRSAYEEAVSSYADLDRDALRSAAVDALRRRRPQARAPRR